MLKRNILLNPGPATTTDSVKMAQVVSDICPREKEFGNLMSYVSEKLTQIAGGDKDYTTVLLAGSGTAVMDAMINSAVPPEKKVLIINNGAYGKRMVQIATAYRIPVVELNYGLGIMPKPEDVERELARDASIEAIAMVHHETTTGMLNPVPQVGELSAKYHKIFLVDTISSFAGIPFSIKDYHIDFMASTSNKCIQGMPGCAFIVAKHAAFQKLQSYAPRSFYLNLYQHYEYFSKHQQTPFTPPVQVLYALKQSIDEFLSEGALARHARYMANWKCLVQGMLKLGFSKLLPDEMESHILTTFHYLQHPKFDFDQMHDLLYERGFTIYPGKIGGKDTFRLANMGAIYPKDMEAFIENLAIVLKIMGIS